MLMFVGREERQARRDCPAPGSGISRETLRRFSRRPLHSRSVLRSDLQLLQLYTRPVRRRARTSLRDSRGGGDKAGVGAAVGGYNLLRRGYAITT